MKYILYYVTHGLVIFYDGNSATELLGDAKQYDRIGDAMQVASELNKFHTENYWKIKSI